MKVTFFSNFLNHHQLPFCKEMYRLLGEDFKFIATEPIDEGRLKMGYRDMSKDYPFSINTYDNEQLYNQGIALGNTSDVVIIGSAPDKFIEQRLKYNKLTFRYSERIFKEGQWEILRPRVMGSLVKKHTIHYGKNLYMLSASAYTPIDYALAGAYIGKSYKWGYFPETKIYNPEELFKFKKNKDVEILWVGRFLDWKHPEKAIEIAKLLKNDGINFKLRIIGIGELEDDLKGLLKKYNIEDKVEFLGSMPPNKVREYMEKANIFLFTSDYNEGWGAVLNEAMNSGCAVVASHAIGSVGYLIKHKENGLVYKDDDFEDLYNIVRELAIDGECCKYIGMNAYNTILNKWNASICANNFLNLSESLLNNKQLVIKDGPCSKAKIIPQSRMYDNIINKKSI
ncbi:glycosyltransferase family 4 protein [Clostridium gasigenes]|uniref:Glycosyltransferase involved in cell wall bisynthesis n=1 Tax=Clostridium gasigenes TaxID=94869 RepID=A0A1H0TGY6_9CLOT|nr:glycosyltransferase [Clostridium gasigenes]MBU3090130.1 glycosyltransferase [Clostridium gasigenes]SDP52950.1 Glycosyltransferase involved in cell wall bisynthesis [Clostridium gasigenes]